jgi:excisionase family DNA binding protein
MTTRKDKDGEGQKTQDWQGFLAYPGFTSAFTSVTLQDHFFAPNSRQSVKLQLLLLIMAPSDQVGGETISVNEAAHRIGVTPQTVRRAIQRGEIPAFVLGRTYRVPKSRFERLIEGLLNLEGTSRRLTPD